MLGPRHVGWVSGPRHGITPRRWAYVCPSPLLGVGAFQFKIVCAGISRCVLEVRQVPEKEVHQLIQQSFLPLYENANMSVLAVILTLFQARKKYRTKAVVIRSQFAIQRWTLPEGHNLPTYEESRIIMRHLGGSQIQHIPACSTKKCDFLFRNRPLRYDPESKFQHANLTHCPQCNETKNDSHGKPKATFTWVGINGQLKQR